MGIQSLRFTQYYVECDICGCGDVIADNFSEHIHSKQQAIKWADMHRIKDGRILCDTCFEQYKKER